MARLPAAFAFMKMASEVLIFGYYSLLLANPTRPAQTCNIAVNQ